MQKILEKLMKKYWKNAKKTGKVREIGNHVYFQHGRQALEVILYEQKGRVLTSYSVSILCKEIHVHLFLFLFGNCQFFLKTNAHGFITFLSIFKSFFLSIS